MIMVNYDNNNNRDIKYNYFIIANEISDTYVERDRGSSGYYQRGRNGRNFRGRGRNNGRNDRGGSNFRQRQDHANYIPECVQVTFH